MNMSKKVNANAGKGGRYRPGETGERFGRPNMAAPGAGVSASARVPTQAHGGRAGPSSPGTDKSAPPPMTRKGSMAPGPAGNAMPAGSMMGMDTRVTQLPPGDAMRRMKRG